MENFIYQNPTRLHFGSGVTKNVARYVQKHGSKALLVYGGGSIKENGLYQRITADLTQLGIAYVEYAGIKPNPVIEDVNNAALLARQNQVDVVVAVGGGSVIDSAKIISLAIHCQCDAWEIILGSVKPIRATPLVAVLTLAATGTETNPFAVVQNPATRQKIGFGSPLVYPKEAFLDPVNTLSVSAAQTTNGIVDTIAHCLEAWFGEGESPLCDQYIVSIIKELMGIAPSLLADLSNVELRSRMMLASNFALNGVTFLGRKGGDWGVHDLGHTLSVLYDLPHGTTLSIAYPAWMKAKKQVVEPRLLKLGQDFFNVNSAEATIKALENLFISLGASVRLSDVGIDSGKADEIVGLLNANKITGNHILLEIADYKEIVRLMFK